MPGSNGAAARSHVYQLLATAFGFPTEELFGLIVDGSYAGTLAQAVSALPYEVADAEVVEGLVPGEAETYDAFQADYIANFEVGMAGPPCPLYGGLYIGGRTQVWEELIRFYNHFGLHLSDANRDLPDHLATELEFLHYLSYREAEAESGDMVEALRRAQRDFVERHPARWLGQLRTRVDKKDAPAFYRTLIGFTEAFVSDDHAYLAALAKVETGQSALARKGPRIS